MDQITFLNNKKIDAELYAYFQSISIGVKQVGGAETRVYKDGMESQAEICKKIGIKSSKTLRSHRDYLISMGYIVDAHEDYYILPDMERQFLMIPLETIKYLHDVVQESVVKTYIYLGQRWKYKQNYSFTIKEVGEHIGILVNNHQDNYDKINNILLTLRTLGLIDYYDDYEIIKGKPVPKKILSGFSLEPQHKEGKKCQ